jgi:hypothetical protein
VTVAHGTLAWRRALRGSGFAPASPWLRLRVWWHQPALTEALAVDETPDDSAELVAVAHELIGVRARRRVADGLDRVLRDALRPARPLSAAASLNRREVLAARDELAALARRLRAQAPVTAHGMALADLLLCDGASPLYNRDAPRSARHLARKARERLDDEIG